jgi:hypothetical protein
MNFWLVVLLVDMPIFGQCTIRLGDIVFQDRATVDQFVNSASEK